MIRFSVVYFIIFIALVSCGKQSELFVDSSDSEIEYWGRTDMSDPDFIGLNWSGTSVKINFEGDSISALMQDDLGTNFYNVIVDSEAPYMLRVDSTKRYYSLASDLGDGKHSVEIFKRTEWDKGTTKFFGFKISGNSKLLSRSEEKSLKLEFYGNSITAGYAVEDPNGNNNPDSIYTNNYLSYASITARSLDAEYRCICKSGIGVTVSWFPLIMPELYGRTVPEDPTSRWDFSAYTPDVVVVNLFQNDSWIVNHPEDANYKARFGDSTPDDNFMVKSYKDFIESIRGCYPDAKIVCLLGNMDITREGSKWIGIVKRAVDEISDPKIYRHVAPTKSGGGHPSIKEQEDLANSLIEFMKREVL